jgi:dolichol-phosphate mannosyltransferase
MMLSVVIAAYNEEKNVRILTSRIIKVLDSHRIPFEILYVVEGEDGTLDVLKKIQKREKRLRVIYSKKPLGLGGAFKRGFLNVNKKATHVLTLDADLNHQPEEIPSFFQTMKKCNTHIVIGSRHIKGGSINTFPLYKRLISEFTNHLVVLVTGMKIKDKTSNYRLYDRRVIDLIAKQMSFKGFESVIETLFIAAKNKCKIVETPIQFKWRIHGKSKLKFSSASLGYVKLFIKILK